MDHRQRRRWLLGLAGVLAGGAALVAVCAGFRGFANEYSMPLLLAGGAAVSGAAAALLGGKAGGRKKANRPENKPAGRH